MFDKLADPLYRLNNLYYITDKMGKKVKFKMTAEQLAYFDSEHHKNIILKARQLGFTTQVCIMQLDCALFESKKCALIAHTLHDAKRLFREKVKFAYDNLPELVRLANPVKIETKEELVFENGGSITVSTSFRGVTLQRLHVSEFGKICAKYPDKAREIVTGAFEAVSLDGIVTLESTAEGRQGYFYEFSQIAEKLYLSKKTLTAQDWRFFFFAWWQNKEYAMAIEPISERLQAYFDSLKSKYGIQLSDEQKAWYQAKERTLGDDMKREYPSLPSEAFEQSIEGAYYAKQFAYLYANGRIDKLPDNEHLPVDTYWDLGVSDSTTIWFIRQVGDEFHIVDYYENSGEGLNHYIKVLKDKGYKYAKHVAPHDIDNRQLGADRAKTLRELARDGYEIDGQIYRLNFDVVPRTSNVNEDIEKVRQILPKCAFDAIKCEQGIKALESYRKEWNDKLGVWRDKPLHDWASHGADAFRYFATYQTKQQYATQLKVSMY
ncbi:terminase [Moraxella nonliquefaciens]|uniref:terminase n=1 Tax=Moraxella nonliquefaciens TaxID=478 RepID=UPI001EF4041C|nr:terminase [Moraxella nonliquefaciens]MCG7412574.1 terminase [Moraxella nonliquefaciens]